MAQFLGLAQKKKHLEQRLNQMIEHYHLPVAVPVSEAISQALERVASNREAVSKRIIENYHEPSFKDKLKFITEF